MNKKHEPGQKHPVGKARNHAPIKMHVHPHSLKALKAVAVKSGIKHHSVGGTGNGIKSPDERY